MSRSLRRFSAFLFVALSATGQAREGFYLPTLELTNVAEIESNVLRMGDCNLSLVSPEGLALTTQSCLRQGVSNFRNGNELLSSGFFAATRADEISLRGDVVPLRLSSMHNVTEEVLASTPQTKQQLIEQCEQAARVTCELQFRADVQQYWMQVWQPITDVRLVFLTPLNASVAGTGDDHWQWPRYAADIALVRLYQDGEPLHVDMPIALGDSALSAGTEVRNVGYAQSTQRGLRVEDVDGYFNQILAAYRARLQQKAQFIDSLQPREVGERYVRQANQWRSVVQQLEQQQRRANQTVLNQMAEQEAQLNAVLQNRPDTTASLGVVRQLDELAARKTEQQLLAVVAQNIFDSELIQAARLVYQYAVERAAGRKTGNRARLELEQQIASLMEGFDADLDRQLWQHMAVFTAQAFPELSSALWPVLSATFDSSSVDVQYRLPGLIDNLYQNTRLDTRNGLLALVTQSREALETSSDGLMKVAIEYEHWLQMHQAQLQALAREQAPLLTKYQYLRNQAIADDLPNAHPNSLAMTIGEIRGGALVDGLYFQPFTHVQGLLAMQPRNVANESEFWSQLQQLAISSESIRALQLNFLSDADSTLGMLGAISLNADGEWVGVVSSATVDYLNTHWAYPRSGRLIHTSAQWLLAYLRLQENGRALAAELNWRQGEVDDTNNPAQ